MYELIATLIATHFPLRSAHLDRAAFDVFVAIPVLWAGLSFLALATPPRTVRKMVAGCCASPTVRPRKSSAIDSREISGRLL
jgi:hypothetical protein